MSATQHRLSKERDLGAWVLGRKRIYLDTSWWIELLNVKLGLSSNQKHADLLLRLQSLVRSGHLVCPLGEGVYLELLKQVDVGTRTATALLMDELSAAVTVIDSRRRLRIEATHFLMEVTAKRGVAGPPLERVWTKVGFVLGNPKIVFSGITEEEQLARDKAFLDILWSRGLGELLDDSDPPFDREDLTLRSGAERITDRTRAYAHEVTKFTEVFLAEVGGFIDLHCEELGAALEEVERTTRGGSATSAARQQEIRESARHMFYNLFRYRKIGNSLPTIRIHAGLHAMNRWLRNRPFYHRDYYDIANASAAIPYCDYFLTEKHLAMITTGAPLNFARRYGVSVMHTVEQALDALNGLGA